MITGVLFGPATIVGRNLKGASGAAGLVWLWLPMMTSTPGTSAAKFVSTLLSTSTLFGSVVNPMWGRAMTTSSLALRVGVIAFAVVIGFENVSPRMLLGSS